MTFAVESGPATVSGSTLTLTGAGNVTINASSAATTNYLSAADVSQTFMVAKANQTITFAAITNKTFGGEAFAIALSASSGLPVAITTTGGISYDAVTGTVSITGAGPASITVAQAGDDNYNAAVAVKRDFNIAKATNSISFTKPDDKTFGDAPFSLMASSTSGAPVSFEVVSGPATVSGSSLTITGAGDMTIRAFQIETVNYEAAGSIDQTFTVAKAIANVTLADLDHTYNGSAKSATATTSASGSSSFTLTYILEGTPIAAANVNNAGNYMVTATLVNANYHGSATGTLVIAKANQTITWSSPPAITYGTALSSVQLNSTALDGASLTYMPIEGTVLGAGTRTLSVKAAATTNYNEATKEVSLTVNKAPVTLVFGQMEYIYDGSLKTATATATPAVDGVSVTGSGTNANEYAATASLNNDNYEANPLEGTLKIKKAPSTTTITISPGTFTFTGSPITPATVTVTGAGGLNLTPVPVYANNINAGMATASYNFADDGNHIGSSDSKSFTISKASSTIAVTGGNTFTYTGAAQGPDAVTKTGSTGTVTLSYSGTTNGGVAYEATTKPTQAGTYSVIATLAEDDNHFGMTSEAFSFSIGKAATTTTVAIAAGPFTFTGSAITPASVKVTGAGGLDLSPNANYANNINAGTASASYSYAEDNNYFASTDSKDFTIGKAATTTTVTLAAGPFTYTGSAITPASVSVTGIGGLNLTPAAVYEDNINAGTATASYSYAGNSNYEASSDSKTFTISKAISTTTVTITGAPFTYTGSAITPATVSVTGAGGLNLAPAVTYANNINAGTATASYSYPGDGNHEPSSDTKNFAIGKAASTVAVTGSNTFIYNATAQGPDAVTKTGSTGAVTYSYSGTSNGDITYAASATKPTLAGSYSVTATLAGDDNHFGMTSEAFGFTIGKATATMALTDLSHTFDGTIKSAGYTISPATVTGVSISNNGKTNAGSYPVTASLNNVNYQATDVAGNLEIAKAPTTTLVTANGAIYTGNAIGGTAAVTGAGGLGQALAVSYMGTGSTTYPTSTSAPTNAGTYNATATYAETANHLSSTDTKEFTIGQATATLSLATLNHEYDGTEKNATAIISPAGLSGISISNNGKVNFGTYEVEATLANNNYIAAPVKGNLVITQKALTVTANNKERAYDVANPSLDGVLSGNVPADGISATYATLATKVSNVGEYTITATLVDPNNKLANYAVTNTSGTLTITPASATITVADLSKIYNGSAQGATVITSPSGIAVNVTYAGSATAPTAAGTYAVVAALNNNNYSATNGTGSLVIAPKSVTGSITASNKVYDGNISASISGRSLVGVLSTDAANVSLGTSGTATFATAAAGNDKTVTATGLALSGTVANNYSLSATTATTTANITAKAITGTFSSANKVYDGGVSAAAANRQLVGVVDGDDVSLTGGTATFADKHVAPGKTVTLTDAALAGDDKGNYTLTSVGTTTAAITSKTLAIAITAENKEYNGNANATVTAQISSGLVENDQVTVAATNGLFNDKHAGVGKAVTANVSKSGDDAGNYSANGTAATTATITSKAMTIAISASDKVYDGNANAQVAASITAGLILNDKVTVSASNGQFNNKNVGTGKLVTASVSKSGDDAGNYSANVIASSTAQITPKALAAASTVSTKVYDGSAATGAVTLGTVTGLIGNETLAITPTASNYATANVGTSKATTITYFLADGTNGGLAANYSMAPISSIGDITAKSINGSFAASDKIYDGSTSASVTGRSLNGVVDSDADYVSLTGGTATFANKNVASGKTVTLIGASLTGVKSSNYSLSGVATTTATITEQTLLVTATGINKVYDGNTVTTVTLSDNRVAGDVLTTAYTSATFADANAGNGITVSVMGISITGGADAGNYILSSPTVATVANITKANAVVVVTPYSGIYDGNSHTASGTATGVNGEILTANLSFASSFTNVPGGTTAWSFAGGNNYNNASGNATVTITPQTANPVADAYYTGSDFYWTTSSTNKSATLTLATTIKNNLNFTGDITTAKVSFFIKNGTTLTPITGAQNLPVGLVDPTNTSVGSAAATVQYNLGSASAATLTIAVRISGNYNALTNAEHDALVTIAVPTPGGIIAGGAKMTQANSAGFVQGATNRKSDVSFYVQYNKSMKNPQGNVELIIRSYNDRNGIAGDVLRTYKIKSTAISVLAVTSPTAEFTSKGNISEVVDGVEQSIEGNLTFQLKVYDAQAPGANASLGTMDQVAVTIFKSKGGIWYSNNWNGVKADLSDLFSGALSVSGNGGGETTSTTTTQSVSVAAPELSAKPQAKLTSYPNPFTDQTTIEFTFDKDEDYNLVVYSANGALVKNLKSGKARANTPVQVTWGDNSYNVGVYFIKLVTTNGVQTVRVVRQ
ncbi:hypothetical protein TH63_16720 [Rufibacter radiotolerans]|uniref:Uncharacterized protein n=1 Tax=Rufibacter radiotolerans TaxID=1379910 RepID=A0A0H4VSY8_9BACT|nr:hypothetical protein TH63_16720 [Rufibacter radiotolerans]